MIKLLDNNLVHVFIFQKKKVSLSLNWNFFQVIEDSYFSLVSDNSFSIRNWLTLTLNYYLWYWTVLAHRQPVVACVSGQEFKNIIKMYGHFVVSWIWHSYIHYTTYFSMLIAFLSDNFAYNSVGINISTRVIFTTYISIYEETADDILWSQNVLLC